MMIISMWTPLIYIIHNIYHLDSFHDSNSLSQQQGRLYPKIQVGFFMIKFALNCSNKT